MIAFLRKSRDGEMVLVVCNFTPRAARQLPVGVPRGGRWRERLNSDAAVLRRQRHRQLRRRRGRAAARARPLPLPDLRLPPLGALFLTPE